MARVLIALEWESFQFDTPVIAPLHIPPFRKKPPARSHKTHSNARPSVTTKLRHGSLLTNNALVFVYCSNFARRSSVYSRQHCYSSPLEGPTSVN